MAQERIDTGKEYEGPRDKEETSRAHKRLIYELFVLGELMDGPHHGYKLREILSNLFGPFRQISWGMLYPLIRQLEREGLLAGRRREDEVAFGRGDDTVHARQTRNLRRAERPG